METSVQCGLGVAWFFSRFSCEGRLAVGGVKPSARGFHGDAWSEEMVGRLWLG